MDADADGDMDADADGDSDVDSDSDSDVDTVPPDAEIPGPCPADMVFIGARGNICIDRYEVSVGGRGEVYSKAGVMPAASLTALDAQYLCEDVEKRLCTSGEWIDACRGEEGNSFPYGNDYDPSTCNGYENSVHAAVHTGSMTSCVGGYPGLFDMSGNVREWSCEDWDCEIANAHGGSFDSMDGGLDCNEMSGSMRADLSYPNLGFRCCLTL